MQIFRCRWGFYQRVRFKTDKEGQVGLVTGIQFNDGSQLYWVTWADRTTSSHYEGELDEAPDLDDEEDDTEAEETEGEE